MGQMLESKVGKYFIIVYALSAIAVYIYTALCSGASCNLYIIVPILPWAFILTRDFGLSFPWAVYPIFILLNASVAYVLGAGIEWLYNRYLDRNEARRLKELNKPEITKRRT